MEPSVPDGSTYFNPTLSFPEKANRQEDGGPALLGWQKLLQLKDIFIVNAELKLQANAEISSGFGQKEC